MRGLTVGSVLNKTFSVWAKNILPFSVLSGLIYLPVFIVAFVMWFSPGKGRKCRSLPV